MALFVNAHPDAWLDGVAVAGQDLRLQLASAFLSGASPSGSTGIASRPGVRYGTGSPLLVQAASGMSITVNAGVAFVQGTASATAGMYTCCLDTTSTITAATSDPTNPRIDNVICQVTDNGDATSTTVVTLQTGTPAPSPVAPTLPANSLLLATVAVAAGVSSITAGNVADKRVYTSASGGILPMANTTGGISGPAGTYAQDLSSGRLRVSDGASHAVQPKTALFAPVSTGPNNWVVSSTTSFTSVVSLSVAADGSTEIEAILTWLDLTLLSGSPSSLDAVVMQFGLGGTTWPGGSPPACIAFTPSGSASGGTFRAWITPPAGTATVTFYAWLSGGTTGTYRINATYFRVQANTSQ